MHSYLITPIDVIMLGEPSPFNSAEQTYRTSLTLLNPIPFFGVLRKQKKDAQIALISLMQKDKFLFPLPFDIVEINERHKFGKLKKNKDRIISSSQDEYFITFGDGKVKAIGESNYVDSDWLEKYLLSEEDSLFDAHSSVKTYTPFSFEQRAGIMINREKRTTEQGYLYFEDYMRFDEKSDGRFFLKTNTNIDKRVVTLGGESKAVNIEKTDKDIDAEFVKQDEIKQKIKDSGLFKLLLLTPTNAPSEIPGAKLIAKILRRPFIYSGWLRNTDKAFPSRLFRLIKPGAVFYYKIEDENREGFVNRLFDRFWLKPAFFTADFPYFESVNGINPICLGLTIIGATKEVKDE